jgi:hypothetical protein
MSRNTLQTIAIAIGVALAIAARFAKMPALLWPAVLLMVFGVTIRNLRQWPR